MSLFRTAAMAVALVSAAPALLGCSSEPPETVGSATQTALYTYTPYPTETSKPTAAARVSPGLIEAHWQLSTALRVGQPGKTTPTSRALAALPVASSTASNSMN